MRAHKIARIRIYKKKKRAIQIQSHLFALPL
jgi:hypothetical protein